MSAMYNLGGILGPIVGGILGDRFSLRIVYYAAGIIFTISTVILFFAGKNKKVATIPHKADQHLFQNKRFMLMLGLIFLVMFAVTLPQPLAANFLQNQRGLSLSRIGEFGSLGAVGSVLLMLVFGGLSPIRGLMLSQISLAIFSLFLWQGNSLLWYGLAYFSLGGYRLARAMTLALVRPVVREREVGLAFGAVESLNALAYVAAPILAGFLYDWQPRSIFSLGLVVLLITIVLSILFLRRLGFAEGGHDEA
jgi:DHA1 family multidrug resistance protein-like MFS transporter